MNGRPFVFLPLRTVGVAENPNRFRPLESRAALHTPGSRALLLRLDELADRQRGVLHRAHCDCCIEDGPIRCACTLLYERVENPFLLAAVRMPEARAGLFHRR